ncbi:hypothetical protein GCM10020001_044180 [Nonomuraea salmonea]
MGFRPFVCGLAGTYGVSGFVGNDPGGVFIEAEGEPGRLEAFTAGLTGQAPPLALVERVSVEAAEPVGEPGFRIVPSRRGERPNPALVPPGRRYVCRLPARTARPRRPQAPVRVRQLHRLRAAVHHRHRRPVRPVRHHDGGLRDVRRLRA